MKKLLIVMIAVIGMSSCSSGKKEWMKGCKAAAKDIFNSMGADVSEEGLEKGCSELHSQQK